MSYKTPLWNPDTNNCVPCPPEKPNFDYTKDMCVDPCPVDKPVWWTADNLGLYRVERCMSCTEAYKTERPFWQPDSGRCVPACPDEVAAPEGSSTCQTCAAVSNGERPFWDPETEECVNKCPELVNGNACMSCAANDQTRPYWNAEAERCQSCAEAFRGESEFWDSNTHTCVKTCETTEASLAISWCVSCTGIWIDGKCSPCPAWLPTWDGKQRRCVPTCPESTPVLLSGKCVSCADATKSRKRFWNGSECVARCPESAPVSGEDGVCRSCAELNRTIPYWDGFKCDWCSKDVGGELLNGSKCSDHCPKGFDYSDHKICETCLEINEKTPLWNGGNCEACPSGQYFSNSSCSAECPAGLLKPLSGQICVSTCGKFQISDGAQCACADGLESRGGECVPPDGTTWANFTHACVAAGLVVSLDGISCVVQCDEQEKIVNGRCRCGGNKVLNWDMENCVSPDDCARILSPDDGLKICMKAHSCGDNLFLDTDERHCVPACRTNLSVQDKAANEKKCVTTCPDYAPIKYYDACKTCAETTDQSRPVWDPNSLACRACTAKDGGPNWDNAKQQCVPACPAEKPFWTGFECLDCLTAYPSGALPFWDRNSRFCVQSCPTVVPAPEGANFCPTCAEIHGKEAPLWDPAARECVSDCSETSEDGQCRSCISLHGRSAPRWDTESRTCAGCPQKQWWGANTKKCCSGIPIAGPSAPCGDCSHGMDNKKLWDQKSEECVACPEDRPLWDGNLLQCIPACPANAPVWTGAGCADVFAVCNASRPYLDLGSEKCVPSCPQSWDERGVCKTCAELDSVRKYWNTMTRSCVADCPAGREPEENSTKCLPCEFGKHFDPDTNECADSCPETWDASLVCESCAKSTRGERPFWDPMASECVTACPEVRKPVDGSICRTCRDIDSDKHYWYGENCVANCPQTYFRDVCIPCSEDNGNNAHWNGERCVPCSENEVASYQNGKECVAECPGPSRGNFCYNCPSDEPVFDARTRACRACSAAIDGGDFWDPSAKKCVLTCPDELPTPEYGVCMTCAETTEQNEPVWDPEAKTCRKCTADDGGSFWDSVSGHCVPGCPTTAPKLLPGRVCRACGAGRDRGRFWDGAECVDEC